MEREERDGGVMTIEDRDYKGDLDFETVKDAAFHILWERFNDGYLIGDIKMYLTEGASEVSTKEQRATIEGHLR